MFKTVFKIVRKNIIISSSEIAEVIK